MKSARRLRSFVTNALLLAGAVSLSYLLIGAAYLAFGPRLLPNLINYFPVTATIWWQASAPHPEREPYVALLGDSYASGMGDWRAERRDWREPYHSADVIRALTGKSVLSFGRSGAGSAEAIVSQPAEALDAARCLIFPQLRLPSELVVYFYEGNDLDNNIAYIEQVLSASLDDPLLSQRIAEQLRTDYGVTSPATCLGYFASALIGLVNTALWTPDGELPVPAANEFLIGGRPMQMPGGLQGPSLELDQAGIAAALLVTDRSLEWLTTRLPGVPITVVLVPSVLTVYRPAAPMVTAQIYWDSNGVHDADRVAVQSDLICAGLSAIVSRQGLRFLDARSALRAAARDTLVHGPQDWRHFNRAGYTRLGETVAAVLSGTSVPEGCARLANAAAK